VFTTEVGTALDPRNVGRRFGVLARRAGCPDATLHILRHTAATQLLSNGHDMAAVSEYLGHHSSVITLTVYRAGLSVRPTPWPATRGQSYRCRHMGPPGASWFDRNPGRGLKSCPVTGGRGR
jgi:hypothetical protein